MKYIKQVLPIILTLSFIGTGFSQTFGIKAGFNLSSISIKDEGGDLYSGENEYGFGFHLGGIYEVSLSNVLKLETGLILSNRNFKRNTNIANMHFVTTYTPYYLQIPANLKFQFKLGKANMFLLAGPYMAIGIAGSRRFQFDNSGEPFDMSEPIEWGEDGGELNKIDFGLNTGLGFIFNAYQLSFYYELGLSTLFYSLYTEYELSNKLFGVSLAYHFQNKVVSTTE